MQTLEVSWNGVAGRLVLGLLVGALWSGSSYAQDRPSFDGFRYSRSGGDSRGGDFRGFDRGGFDRGSYDRDRGDRDRGSDRGRDGSSYGAGPSSSSGSSSSSSSSATTVRTPDRVRLSLELQSSYADVDTDRDGQIGLYEWRKAKRPLAQFTQLDANRDGFLTPRELERAASMPVIASTTPAAPGSSPAPVSGAPSTATSVASTSPSPPATPAAPPLSEEERTKADEAQAKSVFSLLDKNGDGKVSADEMATSSRMRPLFEQAGLNFNEPMPADQFIANYVRIQKSRRT